MYPLPMKDSPPMNMPLSLPGLFLVSLLPLAIPAAAQEQGESYATGFKVSPAVLQDKTYSNATPLAFGAAAREAYDEVWELPVEMPPVISQDGNSCVAEALCYGLASYVKGVRMDGDFNYRICAEGSPQWRAHGQDPVSTGDPGPYLSVEEVARSMAEHGICEWSVYPSWRRGISGKARRHAAQHRMAFTGKTLSKEVDAEGRGLVERIKDTLHKYRRPVPFGTRVGSAFCHTHYRGDGIRGGRAYCGRLGPGDESHFMLITGWDDGIRAFKVYNTVGTDFGDQGNIWMAYDLFRQELRGTDVLVAIEPEVADLALYDPVSAAAREKFAAGGIEEAYCKLGERRDRSGDFDQLLFDLESGDIVSGNLQPGQILTATGDVNVRSAAPVRVDTENLRGLILPEPPLGAIRAGEKIELLDFTAFRVNPVGVKGTVTHYWIKFRRAG